jgi:hypothetical protein
MTHIIKDNNRRDINFATSKVREVLPEYYTQENPTLVSFLEKYYNFLDSSGDHAFKTDINNQFSIRDIGETELRFLDELVSEIGNGLQVASFFEQPRLMTRLLSQFYRSKGSLLSIEGFFRAFFNTEVNIEYPKSQIFIVGESEIGPESLRYIINDKLYQTFSILIKSGVSVADYQQLYKRFVHPAGFYFAGQVLLETDFDLGLATAPGAEDLLESADQFILADEASTVVTAGFSQLTGLYDSAGTNVRVDLGQLVSTYQDLTGTELDGIYDNIAQLVDPNSFTLDDSADSIGPDTSLTVETMDNSMFTRYLSDSSY